jgi:hypothetical protein
MSIPADLKSLISCTMRRPAADESGSGQTEAMINRRCELLMFRINHAVYIIYRLIKVVCPITLSEKSLTTGIGTLLKFPTCPQVQSESFND